MNEEKRSVLDFNKQIIFSEVGSFIGGPTFGSISFVLGYGPKTSSLLTVIGAVIGASLFWLLIRINSEIKAGRFTFKRLLKEISAFTPVAMTVAYLFVYPMIFFSTKYLLKHGIHPLLSSSVGVLTGLITYLFFLNIYRILLKKWFNFVL